jgi:hypothetical protein
MKKILGNICFWLGDKISRLAVKLDSGILWNCYQRLMHWSNKLDPWEPTPEQAEELKEAFRNWDDTPDNQ